MTALMKVGDYTISRGKPTFDTSGREQYPIIISMPINTPVDVLRKILVYAMSLVFGEKGTVKNG